MNSRNLISLSLLLTVFTIQSCKEESADIVADFSASVTSIYAGQSINFSDLSTGDPTSWEWTFQGGTPGTSTEEHPSDIAYADAGTYNVTLTASNENGSNTVTKAAYVTVTQLGGGCQGTTSVTDVDGNVYGVVTIGTQCWTVQNLRTSRYRDGSSIPHVTDTQDWSSRTDHAYCFYNNDSGNEADYGKLYNWYAVEDSRGLCPEGWHIPSDYEWSVLADYLGADDDVAGGHMKETGTDHWDAPNSGATNSSGLTGLPGGMRFQEGQFDHLGQNGVFWSSRSESTSLAYYLNLTYDSAESHRTYIYKRSGFSCRCVKD